MMMIADKPQSIPLAHSQKSSHERQQNLNLFTTPKAANNSSLELSPSPSSTSKQQKSKSKSKSKSNSKTKQPQQPQQQLESSSKPTTQKAQSKGSNSRRNNTSSKVVIPPRSVEVSFNTSNTRGSQRVILKSTADDLKQTTQDIKNLLLTPTLPDGSKPNFRSGSSSSSNNSNNSNNKKNFKKSPKSPSSQHAKLNNALTSSGRLPDGSEPNFNNNRSNSAPLSRSGSSNSSRSSKPNSASSNSSNSTDSIRYAGSSFHAEPKAVTLPKPSFLKK